MIGKTELEKWYVNEVSPYRDGLRSWLRARYPSLPDVDNVVEDCFFRVLEMRRNNEVRSPKALLYTVAKNLASDILRRQKVVSFEPITDNRNSFVYTDKDDVAETVSKQQEIELLAEAIRSLPERCRQVFTLRTAYGLSQKEIAQRLNISENTVEKHMTLGIRRCTEFFLRRGVP